jgi:nucleoside-diphosphate-sugar epimerase
MRIFVAGGTGAIGSYVTPALIYRDGGDRWIDEDWPTDRFPSAAGNHAAEANAQQFAHGGGAAVILRFGIFYGLGAAHSEQIMALARRHIGFQAGHPDSYVSSIHVATAWLTTNPSPHVTTPRP